MKTTHIATESMRVDVEDGGGGSPQFVIRDNVLRTVTVLPWERARLLVMLLTPLVKTESEERPRRSDG